MVHGSWQFDGCRVHSSGPCPRSTLSAVLRRGGESRRLPLTEFLTGPGRNALAPGEFVETLELTTLAEREGSCYRRFTVRESMDLAFVGFSALVRLAPEGRTVEHAVLALGAVGPTVESGHEAALLLEGREPTAHLLRECGEAAAAGCHPIDDLRASAATGGALSWPW